MRTGLTGSLCSRIALGFILFTNPVTATADRVSDLIARGETLLMQQQLKRARSVFREAARLSPEGSFPATVGLARVALGLGDTREAVKSAKRAIALANSSAQQAVGYNLVGLAQFRDGIASGLIRFTRDGDESTRRGREIEATFRKAVELVGEEPALARFNLAEVLYLLDQVPEAKAQLARYLALAGSAADADARHLAECLEGVVELDPTSPGSTPPAVVSSRNPEYSELARQRRIEGSTVIVSVLDEHGKLVCSRVVKALPYGLTEATLETLSHWEFEPARVRGKPVKVRYALETRFDLY